MRVAINTPGGNIGRHLSEFLLDAGREITIISRNPGKVADLVDRGARLVRGPFDDRRVLDQAFEDAECVFWLTPPAYRPNFHEWVRATARTAGDAAACRGVKRAIVLSSVGAHNGAGAGPVSPLLDAEEAFRSSIANVLALRAGFFMENFLHSIDTMAVHGTIVEPVPADKRVPMVATRDIARVAADSILGGFSGHRILGVHGPADLSNREASQIISEALGRPMRYVAVPVERARSLFIEHGRPDFVADLLAEMYQALSDGRMDPAEPRTPETTTNTTLAEFACTVLAPALERAA
ncbi:MAG: NmrA family NAD(P)-binding protein [Proteobacteria bacterium]|nr:NmrA family NAD(P)-binding protein [Pseudomonadota bacterium]